MTHVHSNWFIIVPLLIALVGCVSQPTASQVTWAIAIHGGAGTLDRDAPAAELQA